MHYPVRRNTPNPRHSENGRPTLGHQFASQWLLGLFITCFFVFALPQNTIAAISVSKTSFEPGDTIKVSFTDSDNWRDWIGLYEKGTIQESCQSSPAYKSWEFAFLRSGTVRLKTSADLPPGEYQIQMFQSNSYCHLGTPLNVTIGSNNPPANANDNTGNNTKALALENSYLVGENIAIEYFTGTGGSRDWVGIYAQGDLNNSCQRTNKYLSWQYTNGRAGTLNFQSLPAGNYVAQLFSDNSYCHLGQPETFQITEAPDDTNQDNDNNGSDSNAGGNTDDNNNDNNGNDNAQALILNSNTFNAGERIRLAYTTGTDSDKDWVGIYAQGDLNKSCKKTDKYIDWKYTNGKAGNLDFDPLAPGNYIAQLFSDNSYCHLGQSVSFEVSTANNGNNDGNGDDNGNGNDNGGTTGNNTTPPTLAEIFTPLTEHFAASEGNVRITGLDKADAICYASNGVQPSWNNGNCAGNGVSRINNPGATFNITLSCNGQTGAQIARNLKLVFNWPDGKVYLAESQFQLTCQDTTPEPEPEPEPTLSANKDEYNAGDAVTITYNEGTGSDKDWVGIFNAGELNKSCDETERYVTWQYTNGSKGSVTFEDLNTGDYQAQLFADDGYCHVGTPISFSVMPQGGNGGDNNGGDNGNGNDNNGGNDQCPNDPDKQTPGECGCGVPEGSCNPQSNTRVSLNPYENVNWGSWRQYKANFHTHTTRSDGDHDPAEVIDDYHSANYQILAITDHDTVTWPWTNYNRDPDDLGMLAVRGDEFSRSHHVNGFFEFSVSRANHEDGIANVQRQGGLCHFNHPLRYNSAKDWDWYVPWYEDYPACVGIEAINRGTHAHALWDNINENLYANRQQFVWGYANDDMHDRSELYRSFQFMLMPNLSENALRTSKRTGAFYFCHEPRGSGQARVPQIDRIDVDNQAQTITIIPKNQNFKSIRWTGPGSETVGNGTVFNFSNYPSGSFVRAELEGDSGSCYTQPFGIQG